MIRGVSSFLQFLRAITVVFVLVLVQACASKVETSTVSALSDAMNKSIGPTPTASPAPSATATPRPSATATPRPNATATPVPNTSATPGPTSAPVSTPYPNGSLSGFTTYAYTASDNSILDYKLWKPDNMISGQKYPLVVFLHGNGFNGCGDAWANEFNSSGAINFINSAHRAQYPMYVILPKRACNSVGVNLTETQVETSSMEVINLMLNDSNFMIDSDRLYVTGLSGGGGLTTLFMAKHGTKFAGAVPMSGWANGNSTEQAKIATWIFHAINDGTVSFGSSEAIYSTLTGLGNPPIFTRYATGGHGIWSDAYRHPYLLDWLMKQRRGVMNTDSPVNCVIDTPSWAAGSTVNAGGTTINIQGRAFANNNYSSVDPSLSQVLWMGAGFEWIDADPSTAGTQSIVGAMGTSGRLANPGVGSGVANFSLTADVRYNPSLLSVVCAGSSLSASSPSKGGETWYPSRGDLNVKQH